MDVGPDDRCWTRRLIWQEWHDPPPNELHLNHRLAKTCLHGEGTRLKTSLGGSEALRNAKVALILPAPDLSSSLPVVRLARYSASPPASDRILGWKASTATIASTNPSPCAAPGRSFCLLLEGLAGSRLRATRRIPIHPLRAQYFVLSLGAPAGSIRLGMAPSQTLEE